MKRVGRPAFKVTPALRERVEQLVSTGMSQENIGRAIGCNTDTLRLHFATELSTGLAKKRAEVVTMLYRAAKKGNVTAQKKLEEMSRLAGAEAALDAVPDRPAKLGKKEEAAVAAKSAGEGTGWGSDLVTPTTLPN